MQIVNKHTGRKRKAYAKIGWERHKKGLFLYLLKSEGGGAGDMKNGSSIEWVDPEIAGFTASYIGNHFIWTHSENWVEEVEIKTNEDALSLLEQEEAV